MYNSKLWETSGHSQNYKDGMFVLDVEKEKWALKPMNCPGHCVIFDSRDRSYKELPIRMAEFGILHRNEASGALTGLTRVRRFVQDDTHVFCMPSQVRSLISMRYSRLSSRISSRTSLARSSTLCNTFMECSGLISISSYPRVRIITWARSRPGTLRKM